MSKLKCQSLQRGFIWILVLVAGAALAVGGGLYWWQKAKSSLPAQVGEDSLPGIPGIGFPVEVVTPLHQGSEGQAPENGTDSTPTNGWETYRNDKFGYLLQYHPDWHAQTPDEPPYPPPPTGMSFSRSWEDYEEHCDFGILCSQDDGTWHAGETDNLRGQGQYEEGTVTIDGVPAVTFSATGGATVSVSYYFNLNGIYYRMGYNRMRTGEHSDFCDEVFAQMISSFRFID